MPPITTVEVDAGSKSPVVVQGRSAQEPEQVVHARSGGGGQRVSGQDPPGAATRFAVAAWARCRHRDRWTGGARARNGPGPGSRPVAAGCPGVRDRRCGRSWARLPARARRCSLFPGVHPGGEFAVELSVAHPGVVGHLVEHAFLVASRGCGPGEAPIAGRGRHRAHVCRQCRGGHRAPPQMQVTRVNVNSAHSTVPRSADVLEVGHWRVPHSSARWWMSRRPRPDSVDSHSSVERRFVG